MCYVNLLTYLLIYLLTYLFDLSIYLDSRIPWTIFKQGWLQIQIHPIACKMLEEFI